MAEHHNNAPSLMRESVARAGDFVLLLIVLLALENLVVGITYRDRIVAAWEMGIARTHISPMVLALLAPIAVVFGVAEVLLDAKPQSAQRKIVSLLALTVGALIAMSVTHGRHFQNLGVRVPFCALVAFGAGGASFAAYFPLKALAKSSPMTLGALFAISIALFWCLDAFLLVRLYPGFHLACFLGVVVSALLLSGILFVHLRTSRWFRVAPFALVGASMIWSPFAARRSRSFDNLRWLLEERAPLLSKGIWLSNLLAPPLPVSTEVQMELPGEVPRSLDWSKKDILLISVDALRADHLGAYGYGRKTTPYLDTLAARGTVFEAAYCATPHTSYSISSMMLGKMTRPLTQFGVGLSSDTLAESLRRYGYKTAAFYPPAVFFIDADTFRPLAEKRLGFEYAKVEFADPALRLQQLKDYWTAEKGEPVFAWVHFFEPHEPYVHHPNFDFGKADVDRYDSEIAAADAGIGMLVEAFLEKKPESIVIVTADHGEEFGEHDGRYHGTTVYEEQVRVPLIIVGKGVSPGKRIQAPVQTVDLYPTLLSAVGVPRTARIVGRDLGPLLTGKAPDEGSAFADTDKMAMLARGTDRLVCRSSMSGAGTSTSTCVLYDLARDPKELRDTSHERREVFERRKQELRSLRESFGRFERTELPESLRRAIQGEEEALFEILPLLEDVSDAVRRKTAEVLLAVPPHTDRPEDGFEAAKQTALLRAADREKRDDIRSWMKLAMLRSRVASRAPNDLTGPPISLASQWEEVARQSAEVRVQLRLLQWEEALPHEDKRTIRPPESSMRELVGAWQTSGPPQGAMDGPTWRRLVRVLYRAEDARALLALRDTWEASDSYPQLRMELLAAYPPRCPACDTMFAPVFKKTRAATQHVSVQEALERWSLMHKAKP